MSIVVIRDGIIAADTGGSMGDLEFKSSKLIRRDDIAIGFAGYHANGTIFADWYFAGQDLTNLPKFPNRGDGEKSFTAFVLKPYCWEYWNEWFHCDLDMQQNEYMAIGNGFEVAMGAMHMGATAIEAVEAACALMKGCSLPVESEEIGKRDAETL